MYLVDKQGRQFETKEAHEQFIQQADTVGRWEKVHRIPERKRLTWFHSDFGVHVPNDWVPRNEIAEKFNEITGRQMSPELDPVIEMRSSVHSNYANMVAMLGADNRVYLGKEENYHEAPGQYGFYDNKDGSLCFISDQPDMYYFLYGEGWAHSQESMLERGLTTEQYMEFAHLRDSVLLQFTPQREILFAGKPFQPPENYLRNTELDIEGEGGNYNMIDGVVNNTPPVRPDLTDGQTYDEIEALAPETLPSDKPSIMEKLRADRTVQEAHLIQPVPPEREL